MESFLCVYSYEFVIRTFLSYNEHHCHLQLFVPLIFLLLHLILLRAVANLDNLVAHDSVIPLYESIKGFVCCDISSASNDLFVSWTVVGSLGFALATVASIRIIHSSIKSKKKSE